MALTYSGAHQRIRKIKGPASAQTCALCPKVAAEWSYMHSDAPVGHRYSTDPAGGTGCTGRGSRPVDQPHKPPFSQMKKLTPEQVQDALRRVAGGESQRSVARSLGVSQPAITYWVNRTRATT